MGGQFREDYRIVLQYGRTYMQAVFVGEGLLLTL